MPARSGTGPAKLFERVMRVKSPNLTLSVTVRPVDLGALDPVPGIAGDPLELGREPVGIAQILVEGALGADRFVRPVGLDLALVDAAADAPVPVGRAAEMRLRARAALQSRRSAPVRIPSRSILRAVTGPTPWNRATGSEATNSGPFSGVITHRPSGLRWSEASLAMNLQ